MCVSGFGTPSVSRTLRRVSRSTYPPVYGWQARTEAITRFSTEKSRRRAIVSLGSGTPREYSRAAMRSSLGVFPAPPTASAVVTVALELFFFL